MCTSVLLCAVVFNVYVTFDFLIYLFYVVCIYTCDICTYSIWVAGNVKKDLFAVGKLIYQLGACIQIRIIA